MISVLLLIDPSHSQQEFISQLSGRMEVDLTTVNHLDQAKERCKKQSFDIILLPETSPAGTDKKNHLSQVVEWYQHARSTGESSAFLLYDPVSPGNYFIHDISFGAQVVQMADPDEMHLLFSFIRHSANHRKVERSLRKKHDLLGRILSLLPMGCVVTENGVVLWKNGAFEEISGYTGDMILGKNLSSVLEIPGNCEHETPVCSHLLSVQGDLIPVRIYNEQSSGPGGEEIYIVEDRREYQDLTESLKRNEQECQEKLYTSEALILKVKPSGYISFANTAMLHCFKYSLDELIGQHIRILFPDSSGQELPTPVQMFLDISNESEPTSIHILEQVRSNGNKVFIAWSTRTFYNPVGEPTEILCIGSDMTEQNATGEGRISTRIWRDRVIEGTDIDPDVFDAILQTCMEIAREGREGRSLGTCFLVGDLKEVLARSKQLILNPFYGHPPELRQITEKDVREMLKEYALLDGAFIVSGSGMLEAAGRYITVDASQVSLPKGMGTRHSSTAAITSVTKTVGFVVSESGGRVSVIKDGKIMKVIG